MHRTLHVVAPFDLEIKMTLQKQRTRIPQEEEVHHIETITIELSFEEEMAKNEVNRQTLRDFTLLGTQEYQTSIALSTLNANNFEIKPSLIQIVQ